MKSPLPSGGGFCFAPADRGLGAGCGTFRSPSDRATIVPGLSEWQTDRGRNRRIMANDDILAYDAGDVIVAKGDIGDCMYIVLAGSATVDLHDGRQVVFKPGEFFGEMAVIDRQQRNATVLAAEPGTRVLPVDQSRFVYLVSQQPAFAISVMAELSKRLRGGAPIDRPAPQQARHAFTPTEIKPGLWQLRSRSRASNVYLVVGKHRTALVDTGLSSSYDALADALIGLGHPPESIDMVLLTHEHADHVSGTPRIPGKPLIAAHPLAANKLELNDDFATVSGVIGEHVDDFEIEFLLQDGCSVDLAPYRFEVMHAPGHTSGCVCFVDLGNDVVISGDTFMAGGAMGGIFGSGSISDYIHSLARLDRHGVGIVLPGHGRISTTGREDVAVALARARKLLANTRELFKAVNVGDAFEQIMGSLRDLNR